MRRVLLTRKFSNRMRIAFNDKIFDNALKLAREEAYYDALRLFCRIDSYESMLNQMGCLCCMRDVFYAADTYRRFKSKYFATHNCHYDVAKLGAVGKSLLKYAEAKNIKVAEVHGEKSKLYADYSQIAPYDKILENDYYSSDLNEFADMILEENDDATGFFDAKSTEYFDYLHSKLEKAFICGKKKDSDKLAKMYLELETDDIPTLETQLALCAYYQKNSLGAKLAARYANSQDAGERSAKGLSCAVELLMRKKSDKDNLRKLLQFALETDGFPPYDLDDFITISNNHLRDGQMAYKFAKTQFARHKEISLEYLKKCIYVFYNNRDYKLAKQAAIALYQAVPNDPYANAILDYVSVLDNSPLTVPEIGSIAYALPRSIIVRYQVQFAEKLEKGNYLLTNDDLIKISVLITNCKALYWSGNKENYLLTATFVRAILEQCQVEDIAAFESFARSELASVSPDCLVLDILLLKLIKLGFADTIMIAYGDNSYYLDLSKLVVQDEGFVFALSLCAVIQKVDVCEIQQAYLALVAATGVTYNNLHDGRKVAYCLLAVTDKNFTTSVYVDLFYPEEKELYAQYLEIINS